MWWWVEEQGVQGERKRKRSRTVRDGEDGRMGEKEWKELISEEVGGETGIRLRGGLHALWPQDWGWSNRGET